MVIDVYEKCRDLGIEYSDYKEAVRLNGRMIARRMREGDHTVDTYLDDIKSLPKRPMVALIRYDGLNRRYPEVFDLDGPIPGVEAPYPYAGREGGE